VEVVKKGDGNGEKRGQKSCERTAGKDIIPNPWGAAGPKGGRTANETAGTDLPYFTEKSKKTEDMKGAPFHS